MTQKYHCSDKYHLVNALKNSLQNQKKWCNKDKLNILKQYKTKIYRNKKHVF